MSNIKKKEKNLNQLIDKLNSLSLSYSQPNYELEKIRTEKNELAYQKKEIEKKNEELTREHKYLKEKIKIDNKKFARGPANIISALCHLGLESKVFLICSSVNCSFTSGSCSISLFVIMET